MIDNSVDNNIIAFRLQELIGAKKWTQARLAGELNKSRKTINRWFTGANIPSPKNLLKVAVATGCSLDWLRDGEGEMFPPPNAAKIPGMSIVGNRNNGNMHAGGDINQASRQYRNPDIQTLAELLDEFAAPAEITQLIKKYQKRKEEFDL